MNVRKEIDRFSKESDKPVLHWLFDRYHMASQWRFVAMCTWDRYGSNSYAVNRVWTPTKEGYILYEARCTKQDKVDAADSEHPS
jgi:hypothetical protein